MKQFTCGVKWYQSRIWVCLIAMVSCCVAVTAWTGMHAPPARALFFDGENAGRYIPGVGAESLGGFFLGAYVSPRNLSQEDPVWCVHMWRANPQPDDQATVSTLNDSRQWGPPELDLNVPQTAWLLSKYQMDPTPNVRAALSYLMHVNYERDDTGRSAQESVNLLIAKTREHAADVDAHAQEFVQQARRNTVSTHQDTTVEGHNLREGSIRNIAVLNEDGLPVANIPVTVTLNGPAVFADTNTQQWTGITGGEPLTVKWKATGNGTVRYEAVFTMPARQSLTEVLAGPGVQDTITYGNNLNAQSDIVTDPGRSWDVVYDFQPVGVSNVGAARIIDGGAPLSDEFTASAKQDYAGGQWITIDGQPIPLTYEGTAYWVGEHPPAETGHIPPEAKKLGSITLTFYGPGTQRALLENIEAPTGFVTWVWEMKKNNQNVRIHLDGKDILTSELVHEDWSDTFGTEKEITSKRTPISIDSAIAPRITKSGTYLVDDLWVSGFPEDHPQFLGGRGFDADTGTLTQQLLFFPEGLEVIEANKQQAEVIGTVTIPAKNGFYPSIGDSQFMVKPTRAGTYVFVTSFDGDDRVQPLVTSVEDPTEQFIVEHEIPSISTTATDKADGDKMLNPVGPVVINDMVCYTGLLPGRQYVIEGVLMDRESNTPIVDELGNKLTSSVTHTPEKTQGCADVEFQISGEILVGKTTVVFETVTHEGKTIAAHADINDEGQSVETPQPTLATTATDTKDGDKFIDPSQDVSITDRVCYEKLTVGKEYIFEATVMDKETQKPFLNKQGEPHRQTLSHTPVNTHDCVDVTIPIDGTLLVEQKLVVFEQLTHEGLVVAVHEDINDQGQTVDVKKAPHIPVTGSSASMLAWPALLLLGVGYLLQTAARKFTD